MHTKTIRMPNRGISTDGCWRQRGQGAPSTHSDLSDFNAQNCNTTISMSSSEAEAEFDDTPTKRRVSAAPVSYAEDDSDSSDDDVPLSQLKAATPPRPKAAKSAPAKKAPAAKKVTVKKAAASPKKKPTSSSSLSKDYEFASAALYGSDCTKGNLVQKLLCRWWYAMDWPKDVPDKPPANYDSLDGFPGVFVCTKGDQVGKLKDLRDHSQAPTFLNFARKPSSELRDLLIAALEEQKRQLIASEGEGTPTEKELDSLRKWALKLNPDKADKEATKVLKASRLELPGI